MSRKQEFTPMLFPNDSVEMDKVKYPQLASFKLDGIRCIFIDGEMLSRSFKPINNRILQERFQWLKDLTRDNDIIFDGELYSHDIDFNEISGIVRAEKAVVPDSLEFWCFDYIINGQYTTPAKERYENMLSYYDHVLVRMMNEMGCKGFRFLIQKEVYGPGGVEEMFRAALADGFEGLILKSPYGGYHFGRVTLKSGKGYKFKPYRTFDAKIIGVEQATVVRPDSVRKEDEFGHSVASRLKEDRILIPRAAAFNVEWCENGIPIDMKVTLGMTNEEKDAIWMHKDDYIGKWIEFKGMTVGMKDRVRHPIFVRFREDKNGDVVCPGKNLDDVL